VICSQARSFVQSFGHVVTDMVEEDTRTYVFLRKYWYIRMSIVSENTIRTHFSLLQTGFSADIIQLKV
jgi:hypothetical protein